MKTITRTKKFCMMVAACLCVLTAAAQPGPIGNKKMYHWHYFELKVLPEGAGQVKGCHYSQSLDEQEWATAADVRYCDYNMQFAMMTSFNVSAQATGDKAFIGWFRADENGNPGELAGSDAEYSVTHGADKSTETNDEAGYPESPSACYIALFGYVDGKAVPGQEQMGTFNIPTTQEMNGTLTITATPEEGYSFGYWMDSKGNKVSTDAAYSFTVTGRETYTPVFEGGNTLTLTFPEEGALKAFGCADMLVELPMGDDYGVYEICSDSLRNAPYVLPQGDNPYIQEPSMRPYRFSNEVGGLLYGKGMFTLTFTSDGLDRANRYRYETNLMKAVPENGVDIATLESGYSYYTFDGEKNVFNHVTSGRLEEYDAYLAIPETMGIKQEQIDVFLSWEDFLKAYPDVTAIRPVTAGETKADAIYDLSGRKMVYTRKGLYIINGKKQLVK